MFTISQFRLEDQVYPKVFLPSEYSDSLTFKELYESPEIRILDQLDNQVGELVKALNPSKSFSEKELSTLVSQFFIDRERDTYGNWIYFPWKHVLVRLLPEEDFIRVRTQRNNYKITPEEQQELRRKKIGIIGLSVGQSIAYAIALERGCGELRLADFDTLELSNLNRIKAGVIDLGVEKVVLAAREISEIDPYLKITLFRDGISASTVESFLSDGGDLDLLIDECDSLDIKVLARERARAKKIPVLMETSDRGMLDVERFDKEPDRPVFHGLLGEMNFKDLMALNKDQKLPMALKITGISTVSTRMKASLLEVNQTIASWPQLASAVYLGGASVAHASRKLLLGDTMESGRYYVDLDEIVRKNEPELTKQNSSVDTTDEEFIRLLPRISNGSGYLLTEEELRQLVTKANTAPSGGNSQPWKWVFDKIGVLHLLHDKQKSVSLLDYKGTGSLLAFGAALENLRLEGASMGIEMKIDFQIKEFDQQLIASVYFLSKSDSPLDVAHANLSAGIDLRCTNRKNAQRESVPVEKLNEFRSIANELGIDLEVLDQEVQLKALCPILGGMDRLRLLHEQGYKDFINEIRWSSDEAILTNDGIDIATLELEKAGRAAMGLIRDPGTVAFFRKHDLGYGLSKISDETVMTSSAVLMLLADEYTPMSFLKAGMALQRIWIEANMGGYSVQPVSASLFIFQRVKREEKNGFNDLEKLQINKFANQLQKLFNQSGMKEEMFMIRINKADEPSMRAFRREFSKSLIIL